MSEATRAASRRYYQKNKEAEQGNKCAICRQETNLLVVDHNHLCCPSRKSRAGYKTCGRCNRGLLCRSCNTAIGLFKESEQVLSSAIQYLKGYQQ